MTGLSGLRRRSREVAGYLVAVTLEAARAWLDAARTPEGAWGYRPGQPASAEPSLLAAAAGCDLDPAWAETGTRGWSLMMVAACTRGLAAHEAARARALEAVQAWTPGTVAQTAGDFDGTLQGWSWVPNTFSWVEPTLWAVLSLRGARRGAQPRCVEGLAVLADRQGRDGGWNAGNPTILGEDLPSYGYLTGLVLMALPPGHASVRAALDFLVAAEAQPSAYGLAATVLGRLAHGAVLNGADAALLARQREDGSFDGRVDRTALALVALLAAAGEPVPLLLEAA